MCVIYPRLNTGFSQAAVTQAGKRGCVQAAGVAGNRHVQAGSRAGLPPLFTSSLLPSSLLLLLLLLLPPAAAGAPKAKKRREREEERRGWWRAPDSLLDLFTYHHSVCHCRRGEEPAGLTSCVQSEETYGEKGSAWHRDRDRQLQGSVCPASGWVFLLPLPPPPCLTSLLPPPAPCHFLTVTCPNGEGEGSYV